MSKELQLSGFCHQRLLHHAAIIMITATSGRRLPLFMTSYPACSAIPNEKLEAPTMSIIIDSADVPVF
jgi:hypothetical protein